MVKNEHSGGTWVLHCVVEEERIPGNYTLSLQPRWSDYRPCAVAPQLNPPDCTLNQNTARPPGLEPPLRAAVASLGLLSCPWALHSCQAKALSAPWGCQDPSGSCGSAHALACPEVPFSLPSCHTFPPHTWPSHLSSPPRSFPNPSPPQEEGLCCSFFYLGA